MTSPATDPRAARSREAILAAAYDLLAREGPGAITHQRVAQQAGVGRATVYRHWAAPEDLLRDVLFSAELPFFATPALPLRSWLHAELRQLADELALPAVASLAIALMEQTRPGGAGARPHRHITTITERLAAAFAQTRKPDPPGTARPAGRTTTSTTRPQHHPRSLAGALDEQPSHHRNLTPRGARDPAAGWRQPPRGELNRGLSLEQAPGRRHARRAGTA